ncbi:MAG: MBL fold metallo-hydrolase [Gemmatimonadota bacterium]|nr:MBL fold metallo-hydrolase [Gemmatimonadota bacterium]
MRDTSGNSAFQVTLVQTGEPWNENCYVIHDAAAREQIIVDPGGRSEAIREAAEEAGARVKGVVLTHAHHDHVRAAAKVAKHFGVSCHIHSADFRLLRKAPSYSVAFGGKPFPPIADPVPLDVEGELEFSAGQMKILHTPGHTPGSCCLLFPGFAITGDTLMNRKIGRADLPGCDRQALIASVDNLLRLTADDDLLYAGHREPWRVREARSWWFEARENAPSLDFFEPDSPRESVPQ